MGATFYSLAPFFSETKKSYLWNFFRHPFLPNCMVQMSYTKKGAKKHILAPLFYVTHLEPCKVGEKWILFSNFFLQLYEFLKSSDDKQLILRGVRSFLFPKNVDCGPHIFWNTYLRFVAPVFCETPHIKTQEKLNSKNTSSATGKNMNVLKPMYISAAGKNMNERSNIK